MNDLERQLMENVLAGFARGLVEQGGRNPLEVRRALATSALSVLARDHGQAAAVALLHELLATADGSALRDAEPAGRA